MSNDANAGRWRPPVLITEREAGRYDIQGDIVQVASGDGNRQVAKLRRKSAPQAGKR